MRLRSEIDPPADAVDLQRVRSNLLLPGRVQIPQLADELLALEEAVEVLVSLRQPGCSLSVSRLGHHLELPQEVLHQLLDERGGGGCLVPLDTGQRTLAVLVGEVELREPDRDDCCGDERHDDERVLPDQASVRPCGRFHAACSQRS